MEDDPALERARAYGIDLTLLVESLRRTPTERLRRHEEALKLAEAFRRAGEKKHGPLPAPDQRPLQGRR